MKKVSIITINLNNAKGLKQTISSVVTQTFKEIEYIVIDGASTDGSVEVIKNHSSKISHWVSEPDHGVYNAMNKGIKLATGEYCLFLNSGDYLASSRVVEQVAAKNHRADIVYGNMLIDRGNGKKQLGKMPAELSLYKMYTDTLWHPVSFIKRELFTRYGMYDESYKIAADYAFFFKAIIIDGVTTCHAGATVAVFKLDGLSSDPKNIALLKAERERVWHAYLSKTQLQQLEEQLKVTTFNESKLINRILKKIKGS